MYASVSGALNRCETGVLFQFLAVLSSPLVLNFKVCLMLAVKNLFNYSSHLWLVVKRVISIYISANQSGNEHLMKRTTSGFNRNRKRPMQDMSSTIFFSFNQVLHCLHIKFPNFLRFLSFSFCSSSFCSLNFVRVNFFGLAVSTLLRKTCFIAQTSLTGYPLKQSLQLPSFHCHSSHIFDTSFGCRLVLHGLFKYDMGDIVLPGFFWQVIESMK